MSIRNTVRLGPALALLLVVGLVSAAAAESHPRTAGGVEAVLAGLEGGWYGEDNLTPMGPMSFALVFERQPDGSLKARSSLNRETYVELAFAKNDDGRWLLREEAGMEGLGVQGYTLVPIGLVGANHRWVYAADPSFLWVDVGLDGDEMLLDVRLRGEQHVSFRLDRLPADEVPELKAQLELQASQSPEEGVSIYDIAAARAGTAASAAPHDAGEDEAIAAARAAVASRLHEGSAHLELAQVLGGAIQRSPANGPRYGHEMLASLTRAIELDPSLAEAYHWLVGYYLNAPPIAGGSVDKAEETVRRLAELDPAGAAELMREIEARRGGE